MYKFSPSAFWPSTRVSVQSVSVTGIRFCLMIFAEISRQGLRDKRKLSTISACYKYICRHLLDDATSQTKTMTQCFDVSLIFTRIRMFSLPPIMYCVSQADRSNIPAHALTDGDRTIDQNSI